MMENGRWKMEVERWKMKVGGSLRFDGRWKIEDGEYRRTEDGKWKK